MPGADDGGSSDIVRPGDGIKIVRQLAAGLTMKLTSPLAKTGRGAGLLSKVEAGPGPLGNRTGVVGGQPTRYSRFR